jgi:hypothetical protein
MKSISPLIDPLTQEPELVAIQIAREFHGEDPFLKSLNDQIQAIKMLSVPGRKEEFVSTLIALLPLELRTVAAKGWDKLN